MDKNNIYLIVGIIGGIIGIISATVVLPKNILEIQKLIKEQGKGKQIFGSIVALGSWVALIAFTIFLYVYFSSSMQKTTSTLASDITTQVQSTHPDEVQNVSFNTSMQTTQSQQIEPPLEATAKSNVSLHTSMPTKQSQQIETPLEATSKSIVIPEYPKDLDMQKTSTPVPTPPSQDEVIVFADKSLESTVRTAVGKQNVDIYVSDVKNVTSLYINGSLYNAPITDISPLKYFSNLTELEIRITTINDLSVLSNLKNLKSLSLEKNQISDLKGLSNLVNLLSLTIYEEKYLSDINGLKNLTNLENLLINDCRVSDLTPLINLTNLESLYLKGNRISDISPLKGLSNLERLGLSDNQIIDISPLKGLNNLIELSLSGNKITDYSPVSSYYKNIHWRDF